MVPNEKVRFTFGWDQPGNPITPGSTEVEITLHPEGSKTLLRLVHRGLPDDAVSDHTQGWDHYLGRLAVVAAGGDPGPDTLAAGLTPATRLRRAPSRRWPVGRRRGRRLGGRGACSGR